MEIIGYGVLLGIGWYVAPFVIALVVGVAVFAFGAITVIFDSLFGGRR